MKTENKNMRIMEPGNTTEEREAKGTKYKPVQPVVLDTIPEDAVFIRSTDVCKLLNISNSTLRNLRAGELSRSINWAGLSYTAKKKS